MYKYIILELVINFEMFPEFAEFGRALIDQPIWGKIGRVSLGFSSKFGKLFGKIRALIGPYVKHHHNEVYHLGFTRVSI